VPEKNPRIGTLRWPVMLAKREQLPDPNSSGVLEPLTQGIKVYVDIQGARPMTYYAAAQVDTPFTHMIFMRWVDALDTSYVIVRDLRRPNGTIRRELFRIQRILEIEGQERFLRIEAELEQRGT